MSPDLVEREITSEPASAPRLKYTAHIATAPTNALAKAAILAPVQSSSAKVAPVTTIDSPSAMMMKSAQRSAMCPPSIAQSSTVEAPRRGIQKRTAGEMYSTVSAAPQNAIRDVPSASPPSNQSTADALSQERIRTAFRRTGVRCGGVTLNQNAVLPTCIAA